MDGASVAQAAQDRTILPLTPAAGKRNDKAAGRGLKGKKGSKKGKDKSPTEDDKVDPPKEDSKDSPKDSDAPKSDGKLSREEKKCLKLGDMLDARQSSLEANETQLDETIVKILTPGIELWNSEENNADRLSDMDMDSLIMIMMEYMEMDQTWLNYQALIGSWDKFEARGILSEKDLETYMACADYDAAKLTSIEDVTDSIMELSEFFLYASTRMFEPSQDPEAFYTCTSKAFATTGWCTDE